MTRSIEDTNRGLSRWGSGSGSLRKGTRIAISIAVLAHLWAILAPPLSFQTQGPLGSSPSVATLAAPVRGYGEFLYLNRGYAFFAPDPGPSHLVQAAYVDSSGEQVEEMFPDRERHWPRLLYHRHFMLTEFLHEIYQPPGPPAGLAEIDQNEARAWGAARGRYEHVRQSYIDHLNHSRVGSRDLAIRRLEHRIPSFAEILAEPMPLTDPRMYGVLVDRPIDFGEPLDAPEVLPTLGSPEVDLVDREVDMTVAADQPAPTGNPSAEANAQPLPSEATATVAPATDAPVKAVPK